MRYILRRNRPTLAAICLFIFIGLLGGCSAEAETDESGEISLVATTTFLADLAETLAGDRLEVQGLMGPGIDPHLYQASAGDVTTMQEADIVLYHGIHLEGKMGDVFDSLQDQDKTVICAEDGVDPALLLDSEEDEGLYDPHIWFDVSLWQGVAEHVAGALTEADPAGESVYSENLEAYLVELDELDSYIRDRVNELPENQRVLVTAHDAFQYFGNAYGFTVMGLQGISTEAEAGTADMMALADFIAENEIRAIFIESSVPPKTIEALQAAVESRGFDVEIGGELYSDSLGDADSDADTYVGTLRANIDTIVDALAGEAGE